jgi:hypothetical protein
MNISRTGGRSGWDGVINKPESACFQEQWLTPKDWHRTKGNHPRNLINDCQSMIKR